MFCGKCGNSIPAEAQYCGHCGAPTARTPVAEPSLTSPAPVTKRKSTAWHWPKIDDAKTARDAALEGVGVSLFVSAVTGGTAVLSILSRKPILGVNEWALFDAALFALVGWRIYRMSRVWAVLGLLLYLAEMAARILQYFESSGGDSIPPFSVVAAIFTLGFVNAVRGTFAFERFNKQATGVPGASRPMVSTGVQQEVRGGAEVSHGSLPEESQITPARAKPSGTSPWKKLAVTSFCIAGTLALVLLFTRDKNPGAPKESEAFIAQGRMPLPAHLTDADGSPVPGPPEPEIVQLESVETTEGMLRVTVGNVAGDYVLVCNLDVNKEVGVQSCLAPRPQRNYLLFRKNTKWLIKGAKEPASLEFMQDWSVTYSDRENIGLLPAKNSEEEHFRLFWLSSWTAKPAP